MHVVHNIKHNLFENVSRFPQFSKQHDIDNNNVHNSTPTKRPFAGANVDVREADVNSDQVNLIKDIHFVT